MQPLGAPRRSSVSLPNSGPRLEPAQSTEVRSKSFREAREPLGPSLTLPETASQKGLNTALDPQGAEQTLTQDIQKATGAGVNPAAKKSLWSKIFSPATLYAVGIAVTAATGGVAALPMFCVGMAVAVMLHKDLNESTGAAPLPNDSDLDPAPHSDTDSVQDSLMSRMDQAKARLDNYKNDMLDELDDSNLDLTLEDATGADPTARDEALAELDELLRKAETDGNPRVKLAVQWGCYNTLTQLKDEDLKKALTDWPRPLLDLALAQAERYGQDTQMPLTLQTEAKQHAKIISAALLQRGPEA